MINRRSGFTIVELLIVIVVIGILAASTVVAYSGIASSASDVAVKSNLSDFAKLIQQTKLQSSNDTYPDAAGYGIGNLKGFRVAVDSYAVITYCSPYLTGDHYGLMARSVSGNVFYVSDLSGVTQDNSIWDDSGPIRCANLATELGGYSFPSNYGGFSGGLPRPWITGGS